MGSFFHSFFFFLGGGGGGGGYNSRPLRGRGMCLSAPTLGRHCRSVAQLTYRPLKFKFTSNQVELYLMADRKISLIRCSLMHKDSVLIPRFASDTRCQLFFAV